MVRAVLVFSVLCGTASLQGIASAQSQTAQFELASIREHVGGVRVLADFKSSGARAEYQGFSIPMLVMEAWKVRGDQVALSPGVSPGAVYPIMEPGRSARIYEIVALAPEGTAPTRDEFRLIAVSARHPLQARDTYGEAGYAHICSEHKRCAAAKAEFRRRSLPVDL